ncbi:jerky protein homolog-like [Musca vetustissima]|uniref:jerky protein homolog-like n=1 Tax=Musca vetustissima TaxID=27455 RepID=UPI002AB71293|nr:jerky protein homolog-like [Musca vetustissima]
MRIIKNKQTIANVVHKNKNVLMKRQRPGANKTVEDALLIFFKDMRSKEATITGPLLMEKAKDFANKLNVDFTPSYGWLERWKKRENIHFKNIYVEKDTSYDVEIVDEEFGINIERLINADENEPCWESLTDDSIVEYITLSTQENSDENVVLEEDTSAKPALRDAFASINVLTDYFRDNPEARQKLYDLENRMSKNNLYEQKLRLIDNEKVNKQVNDEIVEPSV